MQVCTGQKKKNIRKKIFLSHYTAQKYVKILDFKYFNFKIETKSNKQTYIVCAIN